MQNTVRKRTTIQPGGRLEISDPQLEAGACVDVLISPATMSASQSAWQLISEGPTDRLFSTAHDVDDHLTEERSSWDR